jgi:hypothetical protein
LARPGVPKVKTAPTATHTNEANVLRLKSIDNIRFLLKQLSAG